MAFFTILMSCNNQRTKEETQAIIQQLMDESIEKKLAKYKSTRAKKCTEKILSAASERADSIVISKAKTMKVLQDTFVRPLVPVRPGRPDLLEPIDSSFPEPILNNSIINLSDSTKKQ